MSVDSVNIQSFTSAPGVSDSTPVLPFSSSMRLRSVSPELRDSSCYATLRGGLELCMPFLFLAALSGRVLIY